MGRVPSSWTSVTSVGMGWMCTPNHSSTQNWDYARWVAYGLVFIFGGTIFMTLAGPVWGVLRSAPDQAEQSTAALVQTLQALGDPSTAVFAPLLAFVLGYLSSLRKAAGDGGALVAHSLFLPYIEACAVALVCLPDVRAPLGTPVYFLLAVTLVGREVLWMALGRARLLPCLCHSRSGVQLGQLSSRCGRGADTPNQKSPATIECCISSTT